MICPRCQRIYDDPGLRFCSEDGAALVEPPRVIQTTVKPTRELGVILDRRYAIKGTIGEGGTARVYLAEDMRTGEEVAVKILKRDHALNHAARERFLHE